MILPRSLSSSMYPVHPSMCSYHASIHLINYLCICLSRHSIILLHQFINHSTFVMWQFIYSTLVDQLNVIHLFINHPFMYGGYQSIDSFLLLLCIYSLIILISFTNLKHMFQISCSSECSEQL